MHVHKLLHSVSTLLTLADMDTDKNQTKTTVEDNENPEVTKMRFFSLFSGKCVVRDAVHEPQHPLITSPDTNHCVHFLPSESSHGNSSSLKEIRVKCAVVVCGVFELYFSYI